MQISRKLVISSAVMLPLAFGASASAVNVVLDFSQAGTFFQGSAAASAAVNKAAADLSAAITTTLNASTDTASGTFGSVTVTHDMDWVYIHPSNNSLVTLVNSAMPASEFRIFVGQQRLAGSTLGQGGPGGGQSSSSSTSGPLSDFPPAVAASAVNAGVNFGRGGGPTMFSVNGSFSVGSQNIPFSYKVGPSIGNLWFDIDTNNDNVDDSLAQLESFWHFDHTTPVAPAKIDLYSVALHEMMHALGFGLADTWNDQVNGSNWTGPNVIALLGSGVNAVEPGHINGSLQSPRIDGSGLQTTVMAPTINFGERRTLTQLDVAFMRDLNWDMIPEPTTLGVLVMVLPVALRHRVRRAA